MKLACVICHNQYNLDKHLALILPQCGHKLCRSCCDNFKKSRSPKCPQDQSSFITYKAGSFLELKCDYDIRRAVEKRKGYPQCEKHRKAS